MGAFYKFIDNKLSSKILCTDEEKANLLNEYFESVFTIDNGSFPSFPPRLPTESALKAKV